MKDENAELADEARSLLKDSARRFIDNEYGFDFRRKLTSGESGFSHDMWLRFADLGWLQLPFPEKYGGLDGSPADVAVLMEAFGRGLVVEPYLSSIVLGGALIARGGTEQQKTDIIPALGQGKRFLAFAHSEPQSRYNLADVKTKAQRQNGSYRLSGHKCVVRDAPAADQLVVSARVGGACRDRDGISLFLVDRRATGVGLQSYATVDGHRAAELFLDNVEVDANEVVGEDGAAYPLIESVVDEAILAICAEAVGAMGALVTATCDYLKTRSQFGVPIGSFQVLQHRMVDMFMEDQISRALVFRAAEAVSDCDPVDRARTASAAKVQVCKAARLVGQQAIQLHGAIGMTEELPVGHHFKRLSMISTTFGDADYHLHRFADLGTV